MWYNGESMRDSNMKNMKKKSNKSGKMTNGQLQNGTKGGKMTNGQSRNGGKIRGVRFLMKDRTGNAGVTGVKAGRKKLSRRTILGIVAGVLVLVNLIIGIVALGISNTQPVVPDETETGEIVEEPEEPEEPEENTEDLVAEPGEIDWANYQVAPNKPRYLSIPSIGLNNIPVTEFGVTANNQLGSPTSTRVVGWYYRSAFPGKQGVSVMNAHGGDLGTGIFKTLPRAKVGDEVIIEMGDGRKYTYVIREMNYKKLGDEANNYMSTALYGTLGGEPTLTLITCTGTWLRNLQTYDQRLFVRAALKQ